jgi:4-hydroxy-tetrahydrodipicolinate synthase
MLFEDGNPGGVKAALNKQGLLKLYMRQPLAPISDDLRGRIEIETQRLLSK